MNDKDSNSLPNVWLDKNVQSTPKRLGKLTSKSSLKVYVLIIIFSPVLSY